MITIQDEKLLSILRTNARASISDLARALNLSRSTVQSRMLKLEETGVIKGYSVDYGDAYLSAMVSAHVSIKVKQKLTTKTNLELKQIDAISQLYAISGEFDLIAVGRALLADPEWANKVQNGQEKDIIPFDKSFVENYV